MVNVKWWEPLIVAIPVTCVGLSNNIFQNLGTLTSGYIIMFAIIYILKIPFSKTVEKVDE
jgi:hypothetical protein